MNTHEADILAIIEGDGRRDRCRYVTDSTGTIIREVYDMDGVMVADKEGVAVPYGDYLRTKARTEAVLAAQRAARVREEQQERLARMRAEAKRKAEQARREAEGRERRRVEAMRTEAKRRAAQARAAAEERERTHERAVRQMRIEELLRQCDEEHERIMGLVRANGHDRMGASASVSRPVDDESMAPGQGRDLQAETIPITAQHMPSDPDLEDFAQAYVASKARGGR